MWQEQEQAAALMQQKLDTRRAALDQLRDELAVAQRDLLTERLLHEEAAAELAGRAPAAKLAGALLAARSKLSEFYRLHTEELAAERRNLEQVVAQVPVERQRLEQRRKELEQWHSEREADVQKLIEQLSARESEVECQAAELARQHNGWEEERARYEREMRKLLVELGI
jgi:deoxyribodipyrimidine photolyase